MSHLTSFHLFPDLPAEIRIQIWSYFIPSSSQLHMISVFDAQLYNRVSERGYISDPWSVVSASRRASWGVFQSCREARALATKCYPARECVNEIADQQYVESLKSREASLRGHYCIIPSPHTADVRRSICCSNTDLVLLEPFAFHLETGEGMSVQIESGGCINRYSGIRYLAFWGGDVEGWDRIQESMFDGLDVVFILRTCRSTLPPAPGAQVPLLAPWDIGKHTCTYRNPPVVLQEHCNEYVGKNLYVSTEETLFEALRVKVVVDKTGAKAVVSVCCVRGAMDMIGQLGERDEGAGKHISL